MSELLNTSNTAPTRFCPMCEILVPATLSQCPNCNGPLMMSDPDDLTGKVIDGRYTVIERLGKGGMGVVYKARQRFLDRDVALKVLRPEMAADTMAVRRFLQEAKAASGLRNPHTVTIFEFGSTTEGTLYFTMELLSGLSLREVIEAEGALAPERVVEIGAQVCDSLAEAHDLGIWHRDLKPDNIYLVENPQNTDFAKVLDFGIAKVSTQQTQLTSTGAICGTPQYMSPEQAKGIPLDGRSDIYSLAIVLYEALCGCAPFEANTPIQMLMAHITMEPPTPTVRRPGLQIPKAVEEVVMKALAKEPADRPSTAREFGRALRASIRGPSSMGTHQAVPTASQGPTVKTPEPTEPRPSQEAYAPTVFNTEPPVLSEPLPEYRRGWWKLAVLGGLLLFLAVGAMLWRPWENAPASPPPGGAEAAVSESPGAVGASAAPVAASNDVAAQALDAVAANERVPADVKVDTAPTTPPSDVVPKPAAEAGAKPSLHEPGQQEGTMRNPLGPTDAAGSVLIKPATNPVPPVEPVAQRPKGAEPVPVPADATQPSKGQTEPKGTATNGKNGSGKKVTPGTTKPVDGKSGSEATKGGEGDDSDFVPIREPVVNPANPDDDFVPIQSPKK